MTSSSYRKVALIVAHPDDETLWAGGTVLSHPSWHWFVACLCRGSDTDRSPRFYKALDILRSEGVMGDLDDGPDQNPLVEREMEGAILNLLPHYHFDLIITHDPSGEYTRHLRHEETGRAVIELWHAGKISASELWTFAYEDGQKEYLPRPIKTASVYQVIPGKIWQRKYNIITETYGFEKNSFEAGTTPKAESFWQFSNPGAAHQWLNKNNQENESSGTL